ncbi:MAG TPA: hypothetical protein VFZ59_21210 [Verrucomicrobiae bacterium]|nr:hypothetical protein [Verrucomicrobiae bacterium]
MKESRMNEMNTLETQLRSLTPRRPSPELERRLFAGNMGQVTRDAKGPVTSLVTRQLSPSRLITVLTPVAACVLLTVSMMKESAPELLPNGKQRAAMVALGLSNQNYAAYLPGTYQPTANRVDTFEWTNRGYSNSSMDSFTHSRQGTWDK